VLQVGGDVGKLAFDLGQLRAQFLGHRQTAQGHDAVGFQFQHTLRDTARAGFTGLRGRNHQHALEPVVAQAEVGNDHGMAVVAHDGRGHGLVAKPFLGLGQPGCGVRQITVHHGQLDGAEGSARHARQPLLWQHQVGQQFRVAAAQHGVCWQRLHQGVTGELGVAFPLQGVAGQAQTQKVALQLLQGQPFLPGQAAQVFPFLLA